MLTMTIRQEVSRLKMKYQTDDPYEICEYLDIQVMDRPMGKSPRSCKGFFLVSSRCKLIVINSDLPDSIQRIIIAHELGHAVLHSDSAINTFHESVFVEHRSDGTMLPREIIWEDGQKYEIDRVIDIRPAYAAKAGGQGDRYTIQVNGARTYLYFERSTNLTGNTIGRWFVERKVPLRDLL